MSIVTTLGMKSLADLLLHHHHHSAEVTNTAVPFTITPPGPPLPRQTDLQRELTSATQANSSVVSQAARASLLALWSSPDVLDGVRAVCPSLANATTALEVLERFYDELEVAEITHNFAWAEAGNNFHDVSLYSLTNASYFYNLWELQVLGFRPFNNGSVEDLAEIVAMKYPPFGNGSTLPADYAEAAQRPVYGVVNLLHVDIGNGDFGDVAVVFNRSYADALAIVAPGDTGNFFFHCYQGRTGRGCGFP